MARKNDNLIPALNPPQEQRELVDAYLKSTGSSLEQWCQEQIEQRDAAFNAFFAAIVTANASFLIKQYNHDGSSTSTAPSSSINNRPPLTSRADDDDELS